MIRKVGDIGYRNIKHNKFIVISSVFSIMIALVIFLSMFNFILNSEKTLMDNIHKVYGDMDISISYNRESNKNFTKETLDEIIDKEGIEESSTVLIDFLLVEGSSTYIAGLEDNDLTKSRYKYTSSLEDNSIVINTGLAQKLNKAVGDTVEIENNKFIIKEVLENDKNNSSIPNILIMDIDNLREFTGRVATGVMLKLNEDVINSVSFANEIKDEIDKDLESEIVEENDDVKSNLQSLKVMISVLSVLILIMSGYLILINFDTFLYKYRKDFSVLRSIGASGKQCFNVVFVQSTFINILGCFLGFIISYLFNSKIIKFLKPLFDFEVEVYEFNLLSALIITLVVAIVIEFIMLIPAYKASKILPLKIKEENESLDIKKTYNIFTYSIYFIAVCIYCYGVILKKDKVNSSIYALISSMIFIVGTVIYVRRNIQFILNKLLLLVKKIGGVYSFIAIKNMIPQVKRYSSIIISISVLFMIITFSTSMFNIIEKSDAEYTKSINPGDITVKSILNSESKLDYKILEEFKDLNRDNISYLGSSTGFPLDVTKEIITTVSMNIKPFIKSELIDGNIDLDLKNKVVIREDFAKENNLEVGSEITFFDVEYEDPENIQNAKYSKIDTYEVISIIKHIPDGISKIAVDFTNPLSQIILEDNEEYGDESQFNKLIIFTENTEEYINKLESLKGKYPELKWSITQDLLEEGRDVLLQRWAILIGSIGAILFIVILGTINSLMNDINNRRSEYALLRVLELNPRRVVQVIATQVFTYITIGLVIGVISGEIITVILMSSEGVFSLGFNGRIILIFLALVYSLVFSIVLPFAIKISRKNIINELKSEV